jgi:hypothetical protein
MSEYGFDGAALKSKRTTNPAITPITLVRYVCTRICDRVA